MVPSDKTEKIAFHAVLVLAIIFTLCLLYAIGKIIDTQSSNYLENGKEYLHGDYYDYYRYEWYYYYSDSSKADKVK